MNQTSRHGMTRDTSRHGSFRASIAPILVLASFLGLAGCGLFGGGDSSYPESVDGHRYDPNPSGEPRETIFGEGGLSLFGGGGKAKEGGAGIGVNSYLWRASLDTISFMPLASADPFGGVIITDWYQDPKTPNERFKLTVYIMDRRLRADGVKVSVFRQQQGPKGGWVDASIDDNTAPRIENAILVRARQLRMANIEGESK